MSGPEARPARLGSGRRATRRRPAPDDGFNRRLIAPMVLGSVLNPINSSMIAVALVPVGAAFGAPPAETAWLVTALYLATAVGQPVIGRLVDTYGPRRLYLAGTALVGIAGLLGALAPSLGLLIAARVLLGLGTSAAYPAAMHLTRSEAERTGRSSPTGVLTVLAVANQTVAVVGPTLGGLLIGAGGWRTVFAVNVPLALACLVLGAARLPTAAPSPDRSADHDPDRPDRPEHRDRPDRLDHVGIALFAVLLLALMLFLMKPSPTLWYLPALAVSAAIGFAVRELRAPTPFIDLRALTRNRPLVATYLRQLLGYTAIYAFLYGYTQWLEEGRGLSAVSAGLVLLPLSLTALAVSGLTGRSAAVRGKLLVGSAVQIAACAALLLVDAGSPLVLLIVVAVPAGVSQGLIGLGTQTSLYHQADPVSIASAAGLLRTFMYLGAMAASAANAAFFPHGATTIGLHHLALFMLGGAGLLFLLTLPDRSLGRMTGPDRKDS
ncbi:MFS transporter [Streptomyces sp. 1331.2]|uniref:MFS transporter n=1 Tax=Streptomyces sp. 1331.2 TaxID=1938835 RepID=UPI000BC7536C|nr:MFS transporter [Streptomyces sp. 1331.2]SOB78913.1 Predicted arabinose efflux permease, MFS family [Streptomyces sp. 1331.2]